MTIQSFLFQTSFVTGRVQDAITQYSSEDEESDVNAIVDFVQNTVSARRKDCDVRVCDPIIRNSHFTVLWCGG